MPRGSGWSVSTVKCHTVLVLVCKLRMLAKMAARDLMFILLKNLVVCILYIVSYSYFKTQQSDTIFIIF